MNSTKLENGLTIVTKENKNSNVCTLAYVIKSGSYNELDNERGLAHLVEHMLFKGTVNRDYKQINKDIEGIGGYLNAETSYDYTKYYCTVPDISWEIGCDVLSDMLFNHLLPEDELIKEKNVVMEELKMYNDDPSSFITNKLIEELFVNYDNRKSIGGKVSDIEKITRENVVEFITRNYHPENMIFIATGNVNHNDIVNFIDDYIKKLNIEFISYDTSYPTFKFTELKENLKTYNRNDIEQTHLAFGMLSEYDKTDMYPLYLLANMIGGNSLSILYDVIREKHGLSYTIHFDVECLKDVNMFVGYAGLNSSKDVNETIKIIKDEILNLKNIVDDEMLKNSKLYLIGMIYLSIEKTSGYNNFITDALIHDTDIDIEDVVKNINAVTLEDIYNVITKYIKEENMLFTVLS